MRRRNCIEQSLFYALPSLSIGKSKVDSRYCDLLAKDVERCSMQDALQTNVCSLDYHASLQTVQDEVVHARAPPSVQVRRFSILSRFKDKSYYDFFICLYVCSFILSKQSFILRCLFS